MLWLAIPFLFVFICLFCIYDCIKPKNYPPGPVWLPLVGCWPTFRRLTLKHGLTYLAVKELTCTYGPILGLKLGRHNVVVISTYDLVKKCALQDSFNNRPDLFSFRMRSLGKRKGIIFIDGTKWSQCRKFTMLHLRTFGISNSILKENLAFETQYLINHLEKISKYGAVPMHKQFSAAVLNSLWFMIAGHRFEYDSDKIKQTLNVNYEAFRILDSMGGTVSQMPFLRYIFPGLSGYNNCMRILKILWTFLDEEIKKHEEELSDEPRDLIDAFLLELAKKREDEDTIFDRENLMILCLDLFMAGSETTAGTLASAFLYLLLYPEWLKILQTELDRVVGRSRVPTEDDLPHLPMVEAYIAEIQRYLILAPFAIPHSTAKDVFINEYRIPKDTTVLFNFHSVHNDEMYWDKPNEFRPQRFLNEQGQFCHNNINAAFGIGKRRCPGEMLVRSSLFLFLTSIVHYFDIEFSLDHERPDLMGIDGFTITPKPFYVKLRKRSSDPRD